MPLTHTPVGLGSANAWLRVYVEKRPNLTQFQALDTLSPLLPGELTHIGQECGNGWRKLFNTYAKLCMALGLCDAPWQAFRDEHLLQANSQTQLLFNQPDLSKPGVHIIAGRTFAKKLLENPEFEANLVWLDDEFAIDAQHSLIVCPYFDYRQLSNIKLARLVTLIQSLSK